MLEQVKQMVLVNFMVVACTVLLPQGAGARDDSKSPQGSNEATSLLVKLRDRSSVPGLVLRLDDCARIESSDPNLAASLGALTLGKAPRGAWTRSVKRSEVLEALGSRGVAAERVRFEGAESCEVVASTTTIQADEFVRAAEAVLRRMLEDEGEVDAEWTIQSKVRPLVAPRGRQSRRLSAEPSLGRISRSSAMIRVDVLVDDEELTAVSIAFRLRRYRNVLVTRKNYRRGDPYFAGDLAVERVDVAARSEELLDDVALVDGNVAARNLRVGETLSRRDLERPAIVHKRDSVTVVAAIGKIRVARKGIALADGGRGDSILIEVDPKQPAIAAEVVAPGLVVVAASAPRASLLDAAASYQRPNATPRNTPTSEPKR